MTVNQTALLTAAKAIKSLLAGSTGLATLVSGRIFRGKAPGTTAYPLVVYTCLDAHYRIVVGGRRLLTDATYVVRAINRLPCTADMADQVAAEVDIALNNASSGSLLVAVCEQPLAREYTHDGADYEEVGGIYRLMIKGG